MASNTIKAQVAASPRDLNPSNFDMTAGRMFFYLGDGSVPSNASAVQNASGGSITLTLPDPTVSTGRHLFVSNSGGGAVVSASSNVSPLNGVVGTAILAATAGKWAHLISDGTYWRTIGGN